MGADLRRRSLIWILCAMALIIAGCPLVPEEDVYDPTECPSTNPPDRLDAQPVSTQWVRLSWNYATPDCDGIYVVERRGSGGSWATRESVARHWTLDEVGVPGRQMYYRVKNESGGGYSPVASAVTFDREHWFPVVDGPDAEFAGLRFVDARLGHACGDDAWWITRDAGVTWSARASGGAPTGRLSAIAFADSLLGIVVGVEGLWLTRDGGDNWTHPTTSRDLTDCVFASPRVAVAVGYGMRVFRTVDAGANWTSVQLPGYLNLFTVEFADSNRGWAAGHLGLFATVDAGETWTQVNHGRADVEAFNDLACSRNTLLAICRQGVCRVRGDSLQWSELPLSPYGGLVVAYADSATAFAGSWQGMYRSTDDGRHWLPVSWPLLNPVALDFADPFTGVACGDYDLAGPYLLRTTDGGAE